ncbi:MAG: alpha/beta hydrolase [Pseudomonadales bacterium]|nr:alpha/beta hydrolase [Pseudomonadales bacterium]
MTVRKRLPGTPEPDLVLPGSDGVRIAADCWGREGDPLVLLLHGGGQTRHAWKGTGEALAAAGFHTYSLDARGHGDSDWASDGDYEQDGMVNDLASVVEALGDPHPVLVGASMGGGVSLCAIGDGKVDARALVLVDMAPKIEAEGAQKILAFMRQKPDGFDSLEEVAEAIASYQPHRERPRQLDGLKKNVRLDENDRLRWHWDPAWISDRPFVEVDTRWERLETAAKELNKSLLPTLLVRGGLSDVLSEAGAQEFLMTCPYAEYVNVTDAAHMVAGDRNDIFTSAVAEFLARLDQSGPVRR